MKDARHNGSVIVSTLVVVVLVSGFIGVALTVTANTSRNTRAGSDLATVQTAADAAVEFGYGVWRSHAANTLSAPSAADLAAALATVPTFDDRPGIAPSDGGSLTVVPTDVLGSPVATGTAVKVDLAGYPGWRGRVFNYTAMACYQMPSMSGRNHTSGVKRQFQMATVPLFQSMAFFEHDLELYKPALIIITGLLHTNNNAFVSGASKDTVTIMDYLSYVKSYSHTDDPPFVEKWSGWSPNATISPTYPQGFDAQVHQVGRIEPLGTESSSVLNTADSNPNNDSFREIIEPPNASFTDPPEIATRRMFNKAGMVVKISGSTVTVTGQNGVTVTAPQQTAIAGTITQQTIYDRREGKSVGVSTVDMAQLKPVLDAMPGYNSSTANRLIYIYDVATNDPANPKAIRLINGGQLPDYGLSIASVNPIYIQGDYNTGTTSDPNAVPSNNNGNPLNADAPTAPGYGRPPSSVMADAVMILSNNWSDANSSLTLAKRNATHTTVNTAILSGFLPSGYVNSDGVQYGYSGGMNNFPRFLENWSKIDFTYHGSMVELFESKIFTGEWDTGNIYNPPNRKWNFDTKFSDDPPPGSLDAASYSRGTWVRF